MYRLRLLKLRPSWVVRNADRSMQTRSAVIIVDKRKSVERLQLRPLLAFDANRGGKTFAAANMS